jgi:glycerol-3-phosphate dehydrogenase
LTNFYGTKADMIAKNGDKERLHPEYPFIKQEIIHAMDSEMAVKPNDIICRRIPMAFLNN